MKGGSAQDFGRPAVFFLNGLGDQLMALPAMRALAVLFPDGMELLLGEGMLSFFYRGLPFGEPTRVWWSDFSKKTIDVDRSVRGASPADLFLCVSTWTTPTIVELAHKLGARSTMGHSSLFDRVVPAAESEHMCDVYFSLPKMLSPELQFENFAAPPCFSPAAETAAIRYMQKNVPPGMRVLFVHPETHASKMWNPQSFAWVLNRFLQARTDYIVLLASVYWYPMMLPRYPDRLVLVDEHLELVMTILRHCDLFLGIDSCFLHGADFYRIPGVGLFGPTQPSEWGFRLSTGSRCVYGNGSMNGVRREAVLEALLELASDTTPPRRVCFPAC